MSRLTIKTKDDLPPELRPLWDKMTTYGAFENQAGVMAQRPPIFKHMWSLLVDLADEAVLSKRHLEIALVTVSLLTNATIASRITRQNSRSRASRKRAPSGCSTTGIIRSSTPSTSSLSNIPLRSPTTGT